MKNIKKLVGLALALALALSLAIPAAFAANSGDLTIENPIKGATYKIYRVFDLDENSYNPDTGNYLYKVNDEWRDFIEIGAGKNYVKENEYGFIEWINKTPAGALVGAEEFAKAALAYAEAKPISPSGTETSEDGTPILFNNLNLGYYLLDSSAGALCSLTTTNPHGVVQEKNGKPTVDKIIENSDKTETISTANVGDLVEYKVTVTAQPGNSEYVLHDTMSAGLTFQPGTVVVTWNGRTLTKDTDYTVTTTGLDDGCTFHVDFDETFETTLADFFKGQDANELVGTEIVIKYSAMLNADAIDQENTNEVILKYDNGETTESKTYTYTYNFDLVKTDDSNVLLDGAKFKLYDAPDAATAIKLIKIDDNTYRVAKPDELNTTDEIIAGSVTIQGLSNGTYYLEETEAPHGYNPIKDRQDFTIADANLTGAAFTEVPSATEGEAPDQVYDTESNGVQVVNRTGSLLPSTGGIGTTIFYIGGGILAVGAVILLVVRRRMRIDAE